MNYRMLGRTGLRVSALGFGCMRLPMAGGNVDDRRAIPLLQRAVELGVTYFDTAVGYCSEDSQRALGDAMRGARGRVVLSTKNPEKSPRNLGEWRRNLERSLQLLRTDWIDVYNVHGLSWDAYQLGFCGPDGLQNALFQARAEGLIRHLCFSTHDTPAGIIKLAEEGLFESVTLQYNLLSRANEPAIAYLKERGLGVVVMGPVAGGRLANQTVEGEAGGATSAATALKFVLANPGVTVALSGMSDLAMLEENVAVASRDLALSAAETAEVRRASASQAGLLDLYCTACGYCMPCPSGVNIPENFTLAQLDQAYGMAGLARQRYAQTEGRARLCMECGQCLEKCPQGLEVPAHMRRIVERLDPEAGKPALEARVSGLRQADGGLGIELTLLPFNLTAAELRGELTAEAAGMEMLRRRIKLKPGTHRKVKARCVVPPESARGAIAYQAAFEGAGGQPSVHGECKALFAHRLGEGGAPAPDPAFDPDQARIQGAARAAMGDKALCETHRTRFRVAHDGTILLLAAEVDDDLRGPSDPGEDGHVDCLYVYLDCRPEGKMRKGAYGEGCARLRLMPGLKDGKPRVEIVKGGGLDFSGATARASARAGGYRLEARIPLAALRLAEGRRVIGFDLAQASADPEGKTDLLLVWSGGRGNSRGTAGFGVVCLE
ncbi:MAG: aldo/keto reductase [Candidatus Sumerlaeota bacterium]|nr:aldo/keto reductase [Candidatus Sumerlaeota bacterium]